MFFWASLMQIHILKMLRLHSLNQVCLVRWIKTKFNMILWQTIRCTTIILFSLSFYYTFYFVGNTGLSKLYKYLPQPVLNYKTRLTSKFNNLEQNYIGQLIAITLKLSLLLTSLKQGHVLIIEYLRYFCKSEQVILIVIERG